MSADLFKVQRAQVYLEQYNYVLTSLRNIPKIYIYIYFALNDICYDDKYKRYLRIKYNFIFNYTHPILL